MENIELVKTLRAASDAYYNDGESFMTDAEFDAMENKLRTLDPTNEYFLGIGSEVRGEKVKLPFKMGSLDQLKDDELTGWISRENLNNVDLVATDKEDGSSIMLIYNQDGTLQIALTRGDGHEGLDVTRHVRKMKHVPQTVSTKMAIRAEVIMEDDVFDSLVDTLERETGMRYKNARNFVAGQMNKEEAAPSFYSHVKVVAYEIL